MEKLNHSKEFYPHTTESYNPIKVRCPDCLKLYAVNPDEIKDSKPKFACVSCDKKFWIAYPESIGAGEVMGFPVEWLDGKKKPLAARQVTEKTESVEKEPVPQEVLIPCPKCQSPYARGAAECPQCGVVVSRWEMLQKLKEEGDLGFPASTELRQAWDEVLDNYEDETIHKDFLALCQQEDNLVYASRQYGRLLTAHGGDETAQKMRDQVLALSQVALDSSPKKPEEPTVRYWSFSSFILFFSAALIGVGFFLEPWRNMVGVGVAIIFFTLAFRNYRGK